MDRKIIILGVVLVGILIIACLFYVGEDRTLKEKCVRIETGCCSCANGGEEVCVLKSEAEKIESDKNCSVDVFCAAVYNCKIESCEYVKEECVAR